jgi:ankyrin repeat protein
MEQVIAMVSTLSERVEALLREMGDLPIFQDCGPLGVNTVGRGGDTPLIVAIIRGDLQGMQDLLDAGADPSAVGEDDFTPLHWGAKAGPVFVRALLAKGAMCLTRNVFGELPSDIARQSEQLEMKALLECLIDTEPPSERRVKGF